jgi:hypothetical protein
MNIKGSFMKQISLYLLALATLISSANLYSMDVPNRGQGLNSAQVIHNPNIKFIASDPRYKNSAFIEFQKAKIKANTQQLIREIPKLIESADPIYTKAKARAIIQDSYKLFAGNNKKNPVPGYLEILENLEKDLALNNSLHSLAGRLFELEHAIKLSNSGHTIIEFGPQIQIPEHERTQLQQEHDAHLLMDIDIYALNQENKPIIVEVKSYKYCSEQTEQELCALITGMQILQKKYGIACKLHTKYNFKKTMKSFCSDHQITHTSDSTSDKMLKPNNQRPQRAPNPCLIDEEDFVIIKRSDCIVCYPKIKNNRIDFIRDLEKAHITYIQSLIPTIKIDSDLRNTITRTLSIAQDRLTGIPGFLNPKLSKLVDKAENGGDLLRSVAFEILCALDVPQDKKVIALGAEMFFNPENNPMNGPIYALEDGCYLRESKEHIGYDLDVLVQDTKKQESYSFIEATTGLSDDKAFHKFRTMGTFLGANVYVFHNFFDNQTFERTAYLKEPVVIELESGLKLGELPWHIACRTDACAQMARQNTNIYQPLTLTLGQGFSEKYAAFCKKFKENNSDDASYGPSTYWIIPSESDLHNALASLLKTIDEINKKADMNAYKGRIKAKISRLMIQERENKEIGACACAVLLLQGLRCTMPPELRERFVPQDKQCAIDLDTALGGALDEVAAEQWKTKATPSWERILNEEPIEAEDQDSEETTPRTLDPESPEVVRGSNNATPENLKNNNNKPQ